MMMEVRERRRRMTLSDQLSAAAAVEASPSKLTTSSSSPNLRELLAVRQEEDLRPPARHLPPQHQACGRRSAGVSLGTFLACEKREVPSAGRTAPAAPAAAVVGRTLLDVIRDEEEPGGVEVGAGNGGHGVSWWTFTERLRARRAGGALDGIPAAELVLSPPAAAPSPGARPLSPSAVPNAGEAIATAATSSPSVAVLAGGQAEGSSPATTGATGGAPQRPQQMRVSLMTLLEQTERQGSGRAGLAVSALLEEEAAGEEEVERGRGEKLYAKCCVCMVREKGAAFIPCGHTFCRLCSRELWVSRGSCPLCNGFILEILDIF